MALKMVSRLSLFLYRTSVNPPYPYRPHAFLHQHLTSRVNNTMSHTIRFTRSCMHIACSGLSCLAYNRARGYLVFHLALHGKLEGRLVLDEAGRVGLD